MNPANYDFINAYNGMIKPSSSHNIDNRTAWYFKRYLLQKLISVFEFKNIPEHWAKDYFLYTLFIFGYISVFKTDKFGIIPQHCSLYGYDVFYRPTNIRVANPLIRSNIDARIGKNCEIIKMQPDYCGAWDIIEYYAELMALTTESIIVNLVNSKFAYVFAADNKTGAEALKKMYDQITAGNPAAFVDKNLFKDDGTPSWELFTQNLRNSYIAGDLLEDLAKIDSRFNTEVGIPNVNIAKQSGVSDSEIMSNNIDTRSKCELWLETMRDGVERVNNMFGLDISVDLRFKEMEVQNDGNDDIDRAL